MASNLVQLFQCGSPALEKCGRNAQAADWPCNNSVRALVRPHRLGLTFGPILFKVIFNSHKRLIFTPTLNNREWHLK